MTHPPKRILGFWTLTSLVAGNMIGSGVFMLPAALAKFGTISILAWILTAIGSIFLALVFSRLSQLLPKTGGPYAYCHEAYGDFVGFQLAYNYWIALWIGNAAIAVAFVGYLSVFWPAVATVPWLSCGISIGIVWVLTGVNILGVQQAGIVQLVTTILKMAPLFLLALIGLFFIHKENLAAFNVSHHSNWQALTGAATLTLWSFVGFESATVPAGNVIDPRRNIPRATIIGTVVAAIVYILGTISVMGIIPMDQLANSNSPFADTARVMFGHWGAVIIALAAIIACFGTLNGWILMQAQIPYAAAHDNLFPKPFGKLGKNGTPVIGLVISSLLITVLLLLRYGVNLVDQFTFMILLAVLASLVPYIYTAVAEVVLLINNPGKFEGHRFKTALILSIVAFIYAFWAILGAGQEIVYYGFLLFISSLLVYVWVRARTVGEIKE